MPKTPRPTKVPVLAKSGSKVPKSSLSKAFGDFRIPKSARQEVAKRALDTVRTKQRSKSSGR